MTQCEMILDHCKTHGSITSIEAVMRYGCTRLGARIADLEKRGHRFSHISETNENRYGRKVTFVRYTLMDTGDSNA